MFAKCKNKGSWCRQLKGFRLTYTHFFSSEYKFFQRIDSDYSVAVLEIRLGKANKITSLDISGSAFGAAASLL
jgi:hypothetical protein